MYFFFSCDWGTSSFRLRLVEAEKGTVLSEIRNDDGIASFFKSWKQTNQHEINRVIFYQTYLYDQVKKMNATFNLSYAPVILSGMVSSSIGMMELPYKELPFQCNGTDLITQLINRSEDAQDRMILISGVKSEVDVMRGEETMLTGCNVSMNDAEQLFIFPGTHSKHITVKNGIAQKINTYMTGELFDLLSKKSILSASVEKNETDHNFNDDHFIDGVLKGSSLNLLNSLFHVRTNQLFRKASLSENYDYLSGILIGHELKEITSIKSAAINLVCSEVMKERYLKALDTLGISAGLKYKDADEALINGHCRMMQQCGYLDASKKDFNSLHKSTS